MHRATSGAVDAMRILQILFLLRVCGCLQPISLAITDILEIVKLSKYVVMDEVKRFKLLDEDVGLSSKVNSQRVLFEEIKVFKNKIDMLSAQMGIGWQVLYAMVGYTDIQFERKLKLMEVIKGIDLIKLKYKDMGTFIENKAAYEDLTLVEFARSVISHINGSSQSLLDRMHAIIAPEKDEDYSVVGVPSVFKMLYDIMKVQGNELFCNMQTSEQQLVLYLYNTLALTEVKGFLIMEFSYMLLKLHNAFKAHSTCAHSCLFAGNFAKEIEDAQKRYKDRSATTLSLAINAVEWADYGLWKCDPYKQVKHETYTEITELLQGHIENLKDLNEDRTCFLTNCDSYNSTKSYECYDSRNQDWFCNKNRQCKGNLYNCHFIADATACFADAGTNRRYDYIEQVGKVLGRKKECWRNSYEYKGYNRINDCGCKCDYCMCLCDEQGDNSDRYFNMRSTESKIDHNMVVTGLRFVKKNRIIHLQIQQGKLLPRAQIDEATVDWKPVEDYRIDDHGVSDGLDYHTLTWEKRGFDLDELFMKDDQLLTGVRFRMIGSHLNFQIRVTPFNFRTGTLEVGNSTWRQSVNSLKDRKKVNLDKKDIQIRDRDRSLPVSISGMYLEFTHSDLDMDVAQTTVPFIDTQAVASAKPVPLGGAGIIYKGSKNFGGFITPKIMTYDYSKVLHNAYDDT